MRGEEEEEEEEGNGTNGKGKKWGEGRGGKGGRRKVRKLLERIRKRKGRRRKGWNEGKERRKWDIRHILSNQEGIIVYDDPFKNIYPIASKANNTNEVYIGRIRKDNSVQNGLHLWCVADNIRKGAATNAVQIAKILIERMNE